MATRSRSREGQYRVLGRILSAEAGIGHGSPSVISAWGLGLDQVHRLELYVEPWNEGSWRAAENAGYQREGLLRGWQQVGGQWRDMFMYSLVDAEEA